MTELKMKSDTEQKRLDEAVASQTQQPQQPQEDTTRKIAVIQEIHVEQSASGERFLGGLRGIKTADDYTQASIGVAKAFDEIIKASPPWTYTQDIERLDRKTGQTTHSLHIKSAGWNMLAGLLNCTVVIRSASFYNTPTGGLGGKATAFVIRQDSMAVVGSGESTCTNEEGFWKRADPYAILSMAQTRAIGRAVKNCFGWVIALAGYNLTPAEEMTFDQRVNTDPENTTKASTPAASLPETIEIASKAQCDAYLASLQEAARAEVKQNLITMNTDTIIHWAYANWNMTDNEVTEILGNGKWPAPYYSDLTEKIKLALEVYWSTPEKLEEAGIDLSSYGYTNWKDYVSRTA